MKPRKLIVVVLTSIVVILCHTEAKIGSFWHITDFHYDPLYTLQGDTRRNCRKTDERGSSAHHKALGKFGNYACESPFELIESAAKYMRTKHPENVEFILWTGDIVSGNYDDEQQKYQAIKRMTDLLGTSFSSHFVFPVLGDLDPGPSENLTNLWSHWLPLEALQTFQNSGYYTIEQTQSKLRIVALNTNLFSVRKMSNAHTKRQWEWLVAVLDKAAANNEMVYIVGHSAPGTNSAPGHNGYSLESNDRYLKIIQKYAKIIVGQFFGHAHADTFRVFYNNDEPVSWALLAPSVSPHRDLGGSSNPGLRLYKFDTNHGKVLDYTQFYLDLEASNKAGVAEWATEYNLTQYYGLNDISSHAFHSLADKLKNGPHHESHIFNKYLQAYSVKLGSHEHCDGACTRQHYCSITCLEVLSYRQCVEVAASALAAAADLPVAKTFLIFVAFILSMCIVNMILIDYVYFSI